MSDRELYLVIKAAHDISVPSRHISKATCEAIENAVLNWAGVLEEREAPQMEWASPEDMEPDMTRTIDFLDLGDNIVFHKFRFDFAELRWVQKPDVAQTEKYSPGQWPNLKWRYSNVG